MPATTTAAHGLLQNIDVLTLVSTIAIAVIGWVVALLLQRWNIRKEHQVEVRHDIYKQMVSLHRNAQDAVSQLAAHSSSPFIQMESNMIPFKLNLKKEHKNTGTWLPYTEAECLFEAEQHWNKFVQSLFGDYFDYGKKYLSLMYVLEDWSAAIRPLLGTKQVLNDENRRLQDEILKELQTLQMYASKNGHDWRTWNQKDVEASLERIKDNCYILGSYLGDFMTLLHNQLLSGYFWYKRPIRKTLDPNFKVLTKKGIELRLEKDHEQKLKHLLEGSGTIAK